MNKERLTTLLKHLKTVPEKKFDIGGWNCGTAACAVGHAGRIPAFQNEGFTCRTIPRYEESETGLSNFGWNAVVDFFDLSAPDAEYLFDGQDYPRKDLTTLQEVIDRITSYLKESS